MKLFIVALYGLEYPTMPQFAKDALVCAQRYSGAEVVALTDYVDRVPGWMDVGPYSKRAYQFRQQFIKVCGQDDRSVPTIMRWFIIQDYMEFHLVWQPIAQIDWEVLLFDNLEDHLKKCRVDDLGDGVDYQTPEPHNRSAPYYVRNLTALSFFTAMMEAQAFCRTPLFASHKCGGDMNWWEHARTEGGYTPSSISCEIEGALFDANIMLDQDRYHSNDGAKTLFWKNGKPYFKRRSDDGLVKAVAVHCFWTWKSKTSDLLAKATSGYSD